MISVGSFVKVEPHGRSVIDIHPEDDGSLSGGHLNRKGISADEGSPFCVETEGSRDHLRHVQRALKAVTLSNKCDTPLQDKWRVRTSPSGEDELFFSNKTVIWSKSDGRGSSTLKNSYTFPNHVKDALWASFLGDKDIPVDCVVANDGENLHVVSDEGNHYPVSLPFQVSKIISTNYGLLLERLQDERNSNSTINSPQLPILFALSHPLKEITPLILKSPISKTPHRTTSNMSDAKYRLVATCPDHSIVILYNRSEGCHSIWYLREVFEEEIKGEDQLTLGDTFGLTKNQSPFRGSGVGISLGKRRSSATSPSLSKLTQNSSPSTSWSSLKNSRLASSPHFRSFGSPNFSGSNFSTPEARLQHRLRSLGGVNSSNSPFSHFSATPRALDYCLDDFIEPVIPEQCLEQLWVETTNLSTSPAKKVFMTTDLVGQTFILFLCDHQKTIKLLKFDSANTQSGHLIFGSTTVIPAKDVEPIPNQKMFVILDASNALTVYSGVVKISVIYLPSTMIPSTPMPNARVPKPSREAKRSSSFAFMSPASFCRTSLPGSRQGQQTARISDFWDVDISPIKADVSNTSQPLQLSNITCLMNGCGSRVTTCDSEGSLFRMSLPPLSTSTAVSMCIKSLKAILPRDMSITLLSRWYCYRNASSNDFSEAKELSMFKKCLLSLVGYEIEDLSVDSRRSSKSPEASKKPRLEVDEAGTQEDWLWLMEYEKSLKDRTVESDIFSDNILTPTPTAPLFSYLPTILFALHLTYEEMKLRPLMWNQLPQLQDVLFLFSCDLKRIPYQDHYWRDFPDVCRRINCSSRIVEEDVKNISFPSFFMDSPPNIYSYLIGLLRGRKMSQPMASTSKAVVNSLSPFPYISATCKRIRKLILLFACLYHELVNEKDFLKCIQVHRKVTSTREEEFVMDGKNILRPERMILAMIQLGFTKAVIESYPFGISLILWELTFKGRKDPSPDWPVEAYSLVGRYDLVSLKDDKNFRSTKRISKISDEEKDEDGLLSLNKDALKLLFPEDQRVNEAYNMLQSSKKVKVTVTQRPGVNDHDFIEEQERHLYTICIRTMALSIGRGMLTLRTYKPIVAETLPIPKLCLSGRVPPRNTTVELTHIDIPTNMTTWPLFHNGVAAGLRVCMTASEVVDASWIIYNRPKSSLSSAASDAPNEHAGFLLALGLNGHLSKLSSMTIYEYLHLGNDLTKVAMLLGLAAARRGTKDDAATKALSVNVEALLPPTSTELDITPVVQVASVLGIGLLYQGSGHGHIAEVLLNEIGRPPGPEMEHYIDRESYALAAGLAFGLVNLGRGNQMISTTRYSQESVSMADQLCNYMVGGHKRPLTALQKEKYKTPSYQIREGEYVNADVTSPGATLALGMLFFDSGNEAVAQWVTAPDTQQLLETVRPDFLLLRTLAKGLILWSSIKSTREWVMSHIPEVVTDYAFQRGNTYNPRIDYETMSQAYCNIVAGACFAMGLRFAGSADTFAFKTIMGYTKMFMSLPNQPEVTDQAGRSTIESALNVLVISLALIMAGTGNLEVMRICRYLRSRTSQANVVLYGSHMATHMALGLLFLGGCRFSLSTTKESIAALIISLFPKFPIHSNDNRYHLQAFRHLYVLAVEPRLVIPRDIDSKEFVFVHLTIVTKEGYKKELRAPALIPELSSLNQVILSDDRYWTITFDRRKNWETLTNLLSASDGIMDVKKKVGCLPHHVDPMGYQSIHSQVALKDAVRGWSSPGCLSSQVANFTTDSIVCNYSSLILSVKASSSSSSSSSSTDNESIQQALCSFLVDCASEETIECLDSLSRLDGSRRRIVRDHNEDNNDGHDWRSLLLWQLKMVLSGSRLCPSLKPHLLDGLKAAIDARVKGTCVKEVCRYLRGESVSVSEGSTSVAEGVLAQDLPPFASLSPLQDKTWTFPELVANLHHFNLPIGTMIFLSDSLDKK